MTEIYIPSHLHRQFRDDFDGRVEHVGFFLADYSVEMSRFDIRDWRVVNEGDYEIQTDFHVSLKDHVRGEVIKWAWDEEGCLIEVHSHSPRSEAEFSPSDLSGFDEWVPHVRWRLSGRPYAAIVTAGETIDALAWLEGANRPELIERITLGEEVVATTGATFDRWGNNE